MREGPGLCVALFDAYLGKDPVVPGAKSLGSSPAATERWPVVRRVRIKNC